MRRRLRLGHLYADAMNIYGDRGNILTLVRRCEWRDIELMVDAIGLGEQRDLTAYDLLFFGGGQDRDQMLVYRDLMQLKSSSLREAVAGGAIVLAVCGGYQLLGQSYRTAAGEELPGAGLFGHRTEPGTRRCIGNVALRVPGLTPRDTVVGFENHSGRTLLAPEMHPLGLVLRGCGNNGEDGQEGMWEGNVVGTYLHGSLLPKNPHLADLLLLRALLRRYGEGELAALQDTEEWRAHDTVLRMLGLGAATAAPPAVS